MLAAATGITGVLIGLGAGKTNGPRQLPEHGMARVAETRMPETAVVGGEERSWRRCRCGGVVAEWVELAGRITSEQNHLGAKILDRKAPWVKFNRDGIITG
jgi:hypothetical protein